MTLLKGSPFFGVNFSYSPFLCMWMVRWIFKRCDCLVKCFKKAKLLQSDFDSYFITKRMIRHSQCR